MQSCDAVQGAADICRSSSDNPEKSVLFFRLPRVPSASGAFDFVKREISSLMRTLCGPAEPPSEDEISSAIQEENRIRDLVSKLYSLQPRIPSEIFYSIIRNVHTQPPEKSLRLLGTSVQEACLPENKTGIILAGSHLPPPGLLRIIEESGLRVYGDFLDLGFLYQADRIPEKEGLTDSSALGILNRIPALGQYRRVSEGYRLLISRYRETRSRGVIYYRYPFCDPCGFEFPALKKLLDKDGIPIIKIELESGGEMHQAVTRIEAFREMIGGIL